MARYFYKDNDGNVFEFDKTQVDSGVVGKDLKIMTTAESEAHLNPKPTEQDLAVIERFWRDTELLRADIELNKIQDSDPNATGTVTLWREYRKNLRALPQQPSFPVASARPIAPDL